MIDLIVNGEAIRVEVEPRTHLADLLREQLGLTGTHLGCEQGVCGACTVLLDNEPARACLTLAALCGGRDVRTIEGLDDPVTTALRAAFTAEHALQCGYCTPGMIVTARDIVRRLPDADDERVRLELAGNLCRCTGYAGIVRAIRLVLDDPPAVESAARPSLPEMVFAAPSPIAVVAPSGPAMGQTVMVRAPREAVWRALRDPALIAGCVPGARLTGIEDGTLRGEIAASLGPIQARFTGEALVTYDDADFSGRIAGQGRDRTSGTRLTAEAAFRVTEDGQASRISLTMTYGLRGPLAQFSRGAVVEVFVAEITALVAANLEAALRGEAAPALRRLQGGRLVWRMIGRALRRMVGGGNA